MTVYNLRAPKNTTFRWTRDLSQFAATYNLAAATIRMQARLFPEAPDPPAYAWVTGATSGGVVTFDPLTNLAVFTAPLSDVAALPSELTYDARLEFANSASVPLFGGRLTFGAGVTRIPGDAIATGASGIGDTVSVEGERGTSPVPLPLSLSAAIAAAQGAQLTPAAFLAVASQFSPAQIAAWQAIFGGSGPIPAEGLDLNPISALTVAVLQ